MPNPSNSLSKRAVVRLYEANALLDDIAERHGEEIKHLEALCVRLHNAGTIDLLSLTNSPAFAALGTHSYFTVQHFYCQVIPKLEASARAVMTTCAALVEKAGADLAAGFPNLAFEEWCRKHAQQAASVIRSARQDDSLSKRFLPFAVVGTRKTKTALELIRIYADDRRLAGIHALGRMKHETWKSAQTALTALRAILGDPLNDIARAAALRAAVEILKQWPTEREVELSPLTLAAATDAGPQTILALADTLWLENKALTSDAVRAAFTALIAVDPTHTLILRHIDLALSEIIGTIHEGLAFDFLAALLARSDIAEFLTRSSSFGHRLLQDQPRLHRFLIQAFLAANLGLAKGLTAVLNVIEKPMPFTGDLKALALTPSQLLYLSRKAIGFLFAKPVVMTSLVLGALRISTGEVAVEIEELLFDPVLVNYGGAAHDYLATIAATDVAYPAVGRVLARENTYRSGLAAPGIVKELHPSEAQRNAQRQKMIEQSRVMHKMIQKESVLLSLVHRSVILYGRKSLTFVTDGENKRRAMEMEMRSTGTSFELARATITDPVNLERMLLVFRAEKPPT